MQKKRIMSKVRASHILVKKMGDAEKIIKSVNLKNFADLAREHSTCPSGKKGGDLGQFGRGQMVKEFEKAAFELQPGAISPPVKTQFGYHIIMRTS